MAAIDELFDTVGGWLRAIIQLGFGLALAFLVVDVLFGVQTNIVANVVGLINSFVAEGVVGLIALLIFLAIYRS